MTGKTFSGRLKILGVLLRFLSGAKLAAESFPGWRSNKEVGGRGRVERIFLLMVGFVSKRRNNRRSPETA